MDTDVDGDMPTTLSHPVCPIISYNNTDMRASDLANDSVLPHPPKSNIITSTRSRNIPAYWNDYECSLVPHPKPSIHNILSNPHNLSHFLSYDHVLLLPSIGIYIN